MPHGTAFWFVLVVRASAAETLYDLLGVKASANSRDIKKAWHLSALRLHPDKVEGGPADKSAAAERFKMLAEAYEVLSDAALRQQYDRTGQVPTDKEKASASSKKSTSAEDDEFGFEGGSQQQRQPNSWFQRYGGGFDAFEVGLAQGRARRVRSLEGLRRLLQPAAGIDCRCGRERKYHWHHRFAERVRLRRCQSHLCIRRVLDGGDEGHICSRQMLLRIPYFPFSLAHRVLRLPHEALKPGGGRCAQHAVIHRGQVQQAHPLLNVVQQDGLLGRLDSVLTHLLQPLDGPLQPVRPVLWPQPTSSVDLVP